MKRLAVRAVAVVIGAGALLVASSGAASAHPLGNFTVNRYSGLVVAADGVTVEHVLDLAEIPTAQRSPAIDADGDGRLEPGELAPWAATQCTATEATLRLTVRDVRVPLRVTRSSATTTPGQAGLPILRLACVLHGAVSVKGTTKMGYVDTAATDQVGWREITARGDGVTLVRSDVPTRSTSRRLTNYPKDLLTSPLDVRGAELQVRAGGPALVGEPAGSPTGVARVVGGVSGSFQGLATRNDGSPLVALTALLAALALGAGHAVAPGHGKTIMAFYLSGRQHGALRAATTVGATVTATHTAGVLALGVLVSAGTAFVPARIYPWLTVLSGALVVAVGLTLLRSTRRGHTHGPAGHTHGPGGHTHGPNPHFEVDHALIGTGAKGADQHRPDLPIHVEADRHREIDHALVGTLVAEPDHHAHAHHADGHHADGHAHLMQEPHGQPHDGQSHDGHVHEDHPHESPAPNHRGLIAIGLAGGLLPSPSAVLVLLGALAVGHPWFGVALVVAFGLGMATTLAVVGVLVMRLRERVERRLLRRPGTRVAALLTVLPVLTAVTVTGLGLLLALKGVNALGG
jgi:ABC-type nickel/cobalt efflux system permease component RcnA